MRRRIERRSFPLRRLRMLRGLIAMALLFATACSDASDLPAEDEVAAVSFE